MLRDDYNEGSLRLEYQMLYSSNVLPAGMAQHANLDVHRAIVGDLVASLRTFALSDQAGPVERDVHLYDVAEFPRWVPQWLRKRWTKTRHVTLVVEPKYIYPEASVILPELGKARAIFMDYTRRGEA